jgi:hypothetical protein
MNSRSASLAVIAIIALVLLSPLLYTVAANGFSKSTAPELVLPTKLAAPSGKCIEPTEQMRANHMNILVASRENAVREGIRKVSHSLHNCSTCHQKREEFCDRCHNYVGAKPDCFGCHYYP